MQAPYVPQLRLYQDWLRETRGLSFPSYEHLWRWSVTDQEGFWQSLWDYDQMQSPTPHTAVLADAQMPGAQWFPGAQVNYARQVFRHVEAADRAGMPAIVSENESGEVAELSWSELRRRRRRFRQDAAPPWRAPKRSRRRLHAQCSGNDHRLPRLRKHRRDLERLRAGHGRAGDYRPLQTD